METGGFVASWVRMILSVTHSLSGQEERHHTGRRLCRRQVTADMKLPLLRLERWRNSTEQSLEHRNEAELAQHFGFFCSAEANAWECVFPKERCTPSKEGNPSQNSGCRRIRGGGGIEAGNQLEDITLTMMRLGRRERGNWGQDLGTNLLLPRWTLLPMGPPPWFHCLAGHPQCWASIVSSCKHHPYTSLVSGCLPLAPVFSVLSLHYLSSEL